MGDQNNHDRSTCEQCLRDDLETANECIAELERDLETERIRLAACGVIALADTPDSAAASRAMRDEYRSASCDDVARRVDECMRLREELAALEKSHQALIISFSSGKHPAILELKEELAAAQAMIQRKDEALKKYINAGFGNSTDFYKQGDAYDSAIEAIALPADRTALDAMLAEAEKRGMLKAAERRKDE